MGPRCILEAGFAKQISDLGWEVEIEDPLNGTNFEKEKTDIRELGVKNAGIVGRCCKSLFKTVQSVAKKGRLPITLGGDHSIGIATMAGMLESDPNTCVLWIDAHADINTVRTTELGNLHGCPVSFVMGLDKDTYPEELKWVPPVLKSNRIAYIGLRDVDEGEKKILREHNIPAFSMYHIDKHGIGKVVDMALDRINPERNLKVHFSYDVDALDPLFVPATGTRVQGGLTLREGLFVAEEIAQTGLLSSLDIVETNPLLAETSGHLLDTVSAACAIGRCAMGETLL